MLARALLIVLCFGLFRYAYQAVVTVAGGSSLLSLAAALYWVPVALLLGGMAVYLFARDRRLPEGFRRYFPAIWVSALFGALIVSAFLLVDDLFRIGWRLAGMQPILEGRTQAMSWAGLLSAGLPFTLLMHGMMRNTYRYQVREVKLPLGRLHPDLEHFRIVHISDLHTGSLSREDLVSAAVARINELEPDLILFTGDLVNMLADEAEPWLPIFSRLRAVHGVYSVTGNHDYGDYVAWRNPDDKRGNFERLLSMHRRMGWNLLMNENAVLSVGHARMALIGVENWSNKGRFPKYGKLHEAYPGSEQADVRLLLSHDPSHWKAEVLPRYPGIHAMFAGHTHGFQFGLELGRWRWSPGQYVYPEWAGLYEQDGRYLYVNRGFGYTFYPGRVGMRPEITLVELV